MVTDGAGDVKYLNISHPAYTMFYVYEGRGKIKKFTEWTDRWELERSQAWSIPASGALSYGSVQFNNGEATFPKIALQVGTPAAYRMEPSSVTNKQGYVVNRAQYNEASKPRLSTYPDATTEKYEYNFFQQVTRYEDRLGRVTRYTYDAQGNMLTKEVGLLMVNGVETAQPEHATYQWEYYPQGHANQYLLSAAIDANGHRTEYVYNTNHQLTQILEPDDTGAGNHVAHLTEYETTGARRPVANEDALGRRTEYTYDARSRIIDTIYVQNGSDEKVYYGAPGSGFENLVAAVKDRDDHYTQMRYDAADRMVLQITGLTTEADALNQSYVPDPSALGIESRSYIAGTKLADTVVSNGSKTEYGYDYRQRPITTTVYPRTGKTLSTSRAYVNNELFKTTDSYGYQTLFAYRDSDGQLVRTIRGLTPAFMLFSEGDVITQQRDLNPNAQFLITDTTRDAEGQVTQTTDPRNVTATYSYDSRGRLVTNIAADNTAVAARTGKQTIYTYDPRNLKLTEALPDHVAGSNIGDAGYNLVICAYDGALRIRKRMDQKGDVIAWTYDLANRVTDKVYHPYQQVQTYTDIFAYDTDSRMLTAVSGLYNNMLTFTYAPTNQLSSESLTVDFGTPQTYTIQRNYDSRKLLTQITYPDASTVARTYTARRQLQQVDYNTTTLAQFQYDPGMRETQRTMGNNIVTTRSYNRADNMVTGINTTADAALSFTYTYDANKNVTSETTGGTMANYSWTTPTLNNSGFDNEDRLINWQRTLGFSQHWDLSLVGDWNTNTINGSAETRTHNDVHEILTVTPGNPQTTLLHDAKGNLSRDEKNQTYLWDFNNNLVQAVNTVGETWVYTYDALGRRVSKSVTATLKGGIPGGVGTGSGTATTTTSTTVYVCLSRLVQGMLCGQEIAEYNANTAPGNPLRMYAFGGYVDEPVAMIAPSGELPTILYYHANRRYCVTALTDSSANAVERYAYTAYGVPAILAPDGITPRTTSSYSNAYLYTGRRLDAETNNYYFRARYHSSTLGRFLGRDPLGYPDGMSMYAAYFAMHNGTDPMGQADNVREEGKRKACDLNQVLGEKGCDNPKKIDSDSIIKVAVNLLTALTLKDACGEFEFTDVTNVKDTIVISGLFCSKEQIQNIRKQIDDLKKVIQNAKGKKLAKGCEEGKCCYKAEFDGNYSVEMGIDLMFVDKTCDVKGQLTLDVKGKGKIGLCMCK